MNYIKMPESLENYQLDIKARELAMSILEKDFDDCSECVKIKMYELAIGIQNAYMLANVSASIDELSK